MLLTRTTSIVLASIVLLTACATIRSPEQTRIEALAQECLMGRDRDTIQRVEVDHFGQVMVEGRETTHWRTEMAALRDCLEAKGVRLTAP